MRPIELHQSWGVVDQVSQKVLNPLKGAAYVRTVILVTSYEVFPFKTHRKVLASRCPLQRPSIIFRKVWICPV